MGDQFESFAETIAASGSAVTVERCRAHAQQAVDADAHLLAEMMDDGRSASRVRVWRNSTCLVAPTSFTRLRNFAAADANCPWPVAIRPSGGRVVMHSSHTANISLLNVFALHDRLNIADQFAGLGQLLFPALARLGIAANFDSVSGAYCPGRHDVFVSGRKVAGTAGFVRRNGRCQGSVTHATVRLHDDIRELPIVMAFERQLGLDADYRSTSITSVEEEMAVARERPAFANAV